MNMTACTRIRCPEALLAARAEALFTSDASARAGLTPAQTAEAVRRAVRRHGGTRGCAAEVAAAYGEHPETAVRRMRWARTVIESVYAGPARAVAAH